MFDSRFLALRTVEFPAFSGLRVMMMPFRFDAAADTLPDLSGWKRVVLDLLAQLRPHEGVGYLTIDEAIVAAGETHRRPGLHVDGGGGWGGGKPWGGGSSRANLHGGMVLASSRLGCRGWIGAVDGEPGAEGDCSALLAPGAPMPLVPGRAYWCNPTFLHESLAQPVRGPRQFLRISTPNPHPWYEGYTPNPLGVAPGGPVLPRRGFMDYRPHQEP